MASGLEPVVLHSISYLLSADTCLSLVNMLTDIGFTVEEMGFTDGVPFCIASYTIVLCDRYVYCRCLLTEFIEFSFGTHSTVKTLPHLYLIIIISLFKLIIITKIFGINHSVLVTPTSSASQINVVLHG